MSTEIADEAAPPPYATGASAPAPSKRLGFVAMLLGLGVFVCCVVASILMGIAAGPYADTGPGRFGVTLNLVTDDPAESTLAVLAFVHILLGTGLGLWAITQGIVAITANRGRAFGVVAIVAAFLAPGVSLVVYLSTAFANA
jgi:hypothetical protein